jgi:A/G-specific adenine glycosylase
MQDVEDLGSSNDGECVLIPKTCGDLVHFSGKDEIKAVQRQILKWYDANRRDLPWRGKDIPPYYTWVSEIMAQQTKIATVIEYFERWVVKFPTVTALASATADEVNLMWSGLGYYRRARYLHQGAKFVMEHHGGQLPGTVPELKAIPGIGDYTAGAIASIAFGKRAPLVDGNVVRVMSRLRALGGNAKSKDVHKLCWSLASGLVKETDRPGDFNQSLMELGATVCKPKDPCCGSCPIKSSCRAFNEVWRNDASAKRPDDGAPSVVIDCTQTEAERLDALKPATSVTKYPFKFVKAPPKEEVWLVSLVVCNGKYLLVKRPDGGLLAGQWEFPSIQWSPPADVAGTREPTIVERRAAIDEFLLENFDLRARPSSARARTRKSEVAGASAATERLDLGTKVHVFSHRKHFMFVEKIILPKAETLPEWRPSPSMRESCWASVDDFKTGHGGTGSISLTTGMRKVLALGLSPGGGGGSSKKSKGGTDRKRKQKHTGGVDEKSRKISAYFAKT